MDQVFGSASFQVGTAVKEEYTSGRPGVAPACGRCHWGPVTGKINMGNSFVSQDESSGSGSKRLTGHLPAYTYGNWILDQAPIESCQHCHNLDSYSPNPFVQKIHGVHRGHHMVKPGVAHPEIPEIAGGLPADSTLAHYTNVYYPSKPDGEKDCALCHVDDRWKTAPSALACNGCHETLDLQALTLSPARIYGKPAASGAACKSDQECIDAFTKSARCDTATGNCQATTHPALESKACADCHTADAPGESPISARHEIKLRTQAKGIVFGQVAASGGSGPSASFLPGDAVTVRFTLADNAGNPIDLTARNPTTGAYVYNFDAVVGGPSEDRQRLVGPLNASASRTSLTQSGGVWTLRLPALPNDGLSLPPLNTTAAGTASARGTYAVYLYAGDAPGAGRLGAATYESGSAVVNVHYCPSTASCPGETLRPRQVILRSACQGCHTLVTGHGGLRTDPESCSLCHTHGATDRPVGSQGAPCAKSADCGGYRADSTSWEECRDLLAADGKTLGTDGVPDTCVMTQSPTGPASIELTSLIHSLHYARRRGDYVKPPLLSADVAYVGYQNQVSDFTDRLFPLDMRNCTKCHADSGDACSADPDCGVGQACKRGSCVNVAWLENTGSAPCLACHNTSYGAAHVQLNITPDGVEACGACHGENREFSPAKVHRITSPYVPPYPRTALSAN